MITQTRTLERAEIFFEPPGAVEVACEGDSTVQFLRGNSVPKAITEADAALELLPFGTESVSAKHGLRAVMSSRATLVAHQNAQLPNEDHIRQKRFIEGSRAWGIDVIPNRCSFSTWMSV
jgi:hypothetical protein